MLRRFGLVYSLFSLLVLVVLSVLVLGRLNNARTAHLQTSQASFARLSSRLVDQFSDPDSLDALRAELRSYAEITQNVDALLLYDLDEGLAYVWARTQEVMTIAPDDYSAFRGFPDYSISDVSRVMLRGDLGEETRGRLYVDAVYAVLTWEDAYSPIRDSLIALLAFAFLTVIVILVLGSSGGARSPATAGAPTEDRSASRPAAASRSPERRRPTPTESEPESAPVAPPETLDPAPEAAATEPTSQPVVVEEVPIEGGEPGTLVNPVTGLSFKQHLTRRLGLELERSAYNDQDLSVMLVRFSKLSGPEAHAQAAASILATFQYEDLCFEYDETTFCVVLPNTELPQAIKQAEAFRRSHPQVVIGMSARNGRLVEASRVLAEADRSLAHAANEAGGVVGFRPDPRKYRQYVTQKMTDQD